jgi:hypothetical protein
MAGYRDGWRRKLHNARRELHFGGISDFAIVSASKLHDVGTRR